MRVLVTGGAGYIGTHVVRALVERGDEVLIYDLRPPAPGGPLDGLPALEGDIRDGGLMQAALRDHGTEAVVHLAGLKSVSESLRDPSAYFDTNVRGSLTLCRAMIATGVRSLVFSSSCAVYGTPARLPVDEQLPIGPENPYGESKALVERMLRWFDRTGHLRYASLRYFNAAGAAFDGRSGEDWSTAVNLIPVVMKAALGVGGPVRVYGTDYETPDGSAIRDYIHVVDLAGAHLDALRLLTVEDRSEVINVGTGRGSSVLEVIAEVTRVSGRPVPMRTTDRRRGDPVAVWADSERARTILGWQARFGLQEIIETAWTWHLTGTGVAGSTSSGSR